jgi:hypothetical protein
MTALPLASALAAIHNGTMIGKLNGVIAATTPTGSRTRVHVDAGGDLAREVALQVFGQSAGVLDVFEAAREFTERVGRGLAVLLT